MILIGLWDGSLVEHNHVIFVFDHTSKRDVFRFDEELVIVRVFGDLGWATLNELDPGFTRAVIKLFVTFGWGADIDVID